MKRILQRRKFSPTICAENCRKIFRYVSKPRKISIRKVIQAKLIIEISKISGDKEEIGGGTVLNDRWILTAAHILDNVNETKLEVMIENYAIENQTAEVDLSYVKVLKIHKHPKWISSLRGNPLPAQYNIALIELQEPIQFMEGFKLVRIQRTRDEIPEQHEPFTLPEDMGFMQMPLSISASLDIEKFSKDNESK